MATDLENLLAPQRRESRSEPSLSTLVQGIVGDVQELTRQQFQLFKVETRNELARTWDALTPIVLGVVVVLAGGLVLAIGLAHLLNWWYPSLPLWGAFLIVGGAVALGGGLLTYLGYAKFKTFNPLRDQSLSALQENLQWPTKK